MKNPDEYHIIGTMSGTSLDGLDVAYCVFVKSSGKWQFRILSARTFEYPEEWKNILQQLDKTDARHLVQLHYDYGAYCAALIRQFIQESERNPDFIAFHGQTVFHRPDLGYTFQLGNGGVVAAKTGIPVICDFRSSDVALGGQGAPLVPAGDKLLFSDYDICLNIGGFANLSYDEQNKRIAYDIAPANIILNQYARKAGYEFDRNGEIAAKGNIIQELLHELNSLSYYSAKPPKSLGKEWLESDFLPVVEKYHHFENRDLLRTLTEHMAQLIAGAVNRAPGNNVFATGGGVLNGFLMKCIKNHTEKPLIIPDELIIKFKEALVFAFLGVLRLRGENNCLTSVTGVLRNHCSGAVYL